MEVRVIDAILSLNPNAEVVVKDNHDVDKCEIEWHNSTPEISKEDIKTKMDELQTEYDAQDYARKRQAEYPDIYDYIDGIVKSDQAQIDKYIADCQAVKDKYSKGA
jgi:nucleoside-specific outer membrane channel protein Tsx